MNIHIITIFPKIFVSVFSESILKIAQKKKKVEFHIYDLRKWAVDKHKSVDDKPYGGGAGMIFKIEPVYKALVAIKKQINDPKARIIVMSASGKIFTQKKAVSLSKFKNMIVICPRYEGIDQRVIDHLATDNISIGKYVLTGGEIPAMVVIDSIVRNISGVLGNPKSLKEESFSISATKREYPQYTRPENFRGWKVPKILRTGDHQKIASWREEKTE